MIAEPVCKYRTARSGLSSICELGLYGGKVTDGTCRRCISKENNTPEYAAELFARSERSHPSGVKRLSGCCDRADQA